MRHVTERVFQKPAYHARRCCLYSRMRRIAGGRFHLFASIGRPFFVKSDMETSLLRPELLAGPEMLALRHCYVNLAFLCRRRAAAASLRLVSVRKAKSASAYLRCRDPISAGSTAHSKAVGSDRRRVGLATRVFFLGRTDIFGVDGPRRAAAAAAILRCLIVTSGQPGPPGRPAQQQQHSVNTM